MAGCSQFMHAAFHMLHQLLLLCYAMPLCRHTLGMTCGQRVCQSEANWTDRLQVYALWLERLLHAYLFSSRVRVVVAFYSFILGLVVFCALQAWVPATAWVLSFCVMLASMHRDHQNNDMKTLKEHLDKLKKVQSKFQQMRHVHPHAQTLKAEVDVVVSELESWYQAAEQWFRIH